jgi:hypothetical protein
MEQTNTAGDRILLLKRDTLLNAEQRDLQALRHGQKMRSAPKKKEQDGV